MRPNLLIGLYLAAIAAANLSVAAFGPAASIVNALLLIALDLTARDRLHDAWAGRGIVHKMALLILAGSALSYALNRSAGPIALASCAAFGVSAALDALVYSRLRARPWWQRVNGSNLAGAAADSLIFPLLAFGWPPLWWVMLGQFVAKVAGGWLWSLMLRPRGEAA